MITVIIILSIFLGIFIILSSIVLKDYNNSKKKYYILKTEILTCNTKEKWNLLYRKCIAYNIKNEGRIEFINSLTDLMIIKQKELFK